MKACPGAAGRQTGHRTPLLDWIKRSEVNNGIRPGVTTEERERLKALEKENRELRRANEILKSASAFFAQAALDRELKK
ncbi:transposase IS911 [Alcaligenes faecalis subsp. faecalis NCIB 8687]|nr:transposase IS911 [Alcaligenes faecalis subsp. faecalis NCIB 8687]